MADFDLSIRYENKLQKIGFGASLVLLPFWSMIWPSMLGMSLYFISQYPASLPLYAVALLLLGLTALTVGGFMNSAVMEDDRLNVTADGIVYPPIYANRLKFQLNRPWSTLIKATLEKDSKAQDELLLVYLDGAHVSLNLSASSARIWKNCFWPLNSGQKIATATPH